MTLTEEAVERVREGERARRRERERESREVIKRGKRARYQTS